MPVRVGWLLAVVAALSPAVRADDRPLREVIDTHLAAAWEREKLAAPGRADDATFLRRVYLDLVGTIPTCDETRQFLDDPSADKRALLIDRLLADPRFAEQQAEVWQAVLIGRNPSNQDVVNNGRPVLKQWLAERFAKNKSYARWVRALLLAEGNTQEHGPPLFYAQFGGNAENTAVAVSRIFLGTQLQCAQCHDHPHDKWKQLDFYGLAGFFARLVVVDVTGKRKLMIGEKRSGEVMFTGPASQQKPGQKGTPVPARYLGGNVLDEPPLPTNFKETIARGTVPPRPDFSRKEKLVEWLTAPDNPYFAKTAANRLFAQFMGRGLVHPVDDLRDGRQPSHPELFQALQEQFVAHQFDLRWLIREMVNSKAYQRAGSKEAGEALWFEHARLRPLTSQEMLSALRAASGFNSAVQVASTTEEQVIPGLARVVLRQFGDAVDGRGDFQASLTERLFMNNGAVIKELIRRRKGNLADTVLSLEGGWEGKVDRLFLTVLSRPPSAAERDRFVAHLSSDTKAEPLVEEAIWALLNCSEFRFNR